MPFIAAARRASAVVLLAALAACSPDGIAGPDGTRLGARKPSTPTYATLLVEHTPVLFVHGWNANAGTWTTALARFRDSGYTATELHAFSYNTAQSNATTAKLIAAKVDSIRVATGSARVAIVTHSMGALSGRYYTRNLGGDATTAVLVSLGGPNHGTQTAAFCFQTSCLEMRPNSSFLAALNQTDETWGAPAYYTWWSSCDEVILPQASTPLSGATNNQTACLQHSQLHEDPAVLDAVLAAVKVTPTPRLIASR